MSSEVNLPDIVAQYSDSCYEIKPGIQFAGSILSSEIKCGGSSFLNLIVQNALDVPVRGEIFIDVPSRNFFRKTFLLTEKKINFNLDRTEVNRIVIPIKSSLNTPEGTYQIKIKLKGYGGTGGKKVRGSKEQVDPNKAVVKSVVESALISAVGLLLGGGIGVSIYQPSDEFTVSLKIKDKQVSEDTFSIEHKEEIIWSINDTEYYTYATNWVHSHLDNWKNDSNLKDIVVDNFKKMLKSYFKGKKIELSEEEILWLSKMFFFSSFSWEILNYYYNLPFYLYENKDDLLEKYGVEEDALWNRLSFVKDLIGPLLDLIHVERRTSYISLVITYSAYVLEEMTSKRVTSKDLPQIYKFFEDALSSSDSSIIFNILHNIYIPMILNTSELFDNNEESLEHLDLLEKEINSNQYFAKKNRESIIRVITTMKDKF